MSWGYHKRVKLLPGINLNIGKGGPRRQRRQARRPRQHEPNRGNARSRWA